MTAFRRTTGGVVVSFDTDEVSLLRHLLGEVRALLADPAAPGHLTDPADAADGADGADGAGGAGAVDGGRVSLEELVELTGMTDEPGAAPAHPDDPVLARLLPDGYRDDPGAAGEFRRLTESGLRRQKCELAGRVLADLPPEGSGEVRFDADTTERWLTALNDVRLALGTRLDVTEDMAEPDPDDPDAPAYVVYLWLTELQGVLIELAADLA